jgi:hypothetical protein
MTTSSPFISNSSYFVQPENLKVTFYTAPANGAFIEIFQDNFINFNPKYFIKTESSIVIFDDLF